MKISLLSIGKNDDSFIEQGISHYLKRIKRYIKFDVQLLPHIKNAQSMPITTIKLKEAEILLKQIQKDDCVILLDQIGEQFSSQKFSKFLEKKLTEPHRQIVFIIGGAYGFDTSIYKRANQKISLSSFTLPHQLARLIFMEQVYRACTILKNEPYHH